ncbi:MAG: 50S ribosomal protein L9 [Endomicrobiaceae bacterium]|jgi:large subunit ribosomal protein L9|nr:50S ribosomal protein L9 [Endomicrobiaceae bacterium]
MKVILRSDITNVGRQGEIKDVAAGFARNFLLPKKLGMEATSQNLKIWEREKSRLEKEREEIISNAKVVAEKIEKAEFSITVKVGENGKIFGSITTTHLSKLLSEQGFTVNKHDILLPAPIKEVGKQTLSIRLHPEVIAKIEVNIVEEKHKA